MWMGVILLPRQYIKRRFRHNSEKHDGTKIYDSERSDGEKIYICKRWVWRSENLQKLDGNVTGQNGYKLFQPIMAKALDPRLISEFSSVDPDQSIIKWIGTARLMYRLCEGGKTRMRNPYAVDGRCIHQQLEVHLPATGREKKRTLMQ